MPPTGEAARHSSNRHWHVSCRLLSPLIAVKNMKMQADRLMLVILHLSIHKRFSQEGKAFTEVLAAWRYFFDTKSFQAKSEGED